MVAALYSKAFKDLLLALCVRARLAILVHMHPRAFVRTQCKGRQNARKKKDATDLNRQLVYQQHTMDT